MIHLSQMGRLLKDQVCQNVSVSLQGSMSVPQHTLVSIHFDGKEFIFDSNESVGRREAYQKDIIIDEVTRGWVQAWSNTDENFITQEDKGLIDLASTELGIFIKQQEIDLKFKETTKELQIVNHELTDAIRGRTVAQKMLEDSRELLRKLISYQENVRDEECSRIAREVHDDLMSELARIKAHLSTIITDNKKSNVLPDARLVEAAILTDTAGETVKRIIESLRPVELDHLPLWEAIEMSANKILKRSNIHFEFMIEEAVESIEIQSDLGTALFRIFQEIMTNVVRHANASVVTFQALLNEDDLTITVKDDGHGMITERRSDPNSWGIIGMKERIRYFGGNFTISGGSTGAGTTVTIQLPIEVDFIGLPRRSRIHYQQSPVTCQPVQQS